MKTFGSFACRKTVLAVALGMACGLVSSPRAAQAASRSAAEIGALQVAETFAYAWATRDAALGSRTTDFGHGEGSPGPDEMHAYFGGLSSPHHAAFAIEHMRLAPGGGFTCTMTLYQYLYAGHGNGGFDETKVTIALDKRNGAWKVVAVPGLYGS